jgi:hypothetical protein
MREGERVITLVGWGAAARGAESYEPELDRFLNTCAGSGTPANKSAKGAAHAANRQAQGTAGTPGRPSSGATDDLSLLQLLGLTVGLTILIVLVEAGPAWIFRGLQICARWLLGADGGHVHEDA